MRRARSYSGSATGVRAEPKTETAGRDRRHDAKAAVELVGHPPDAIGVGAHDRDGRRLRVEQLLVGGGGRARVDHGGRRYRRRMDRRPGGQSEDDGRRAQHPEPDAQPATRRPRAPASVTPPDEPAAEADTPAAAPPPAEAEPAAGGTPTEPPAGADTPPDGPGTAAPATEAPADAPARTPRPPTPRPPSPCPPRPEEDARRADGGPGQADAAGPAVRAGGRGPADRAAARAGRARGPQRASAAAAGRPAAVGRPGPPDAARPARRRRATAAPAEGAPADGAPAGAQAPQGEGEQRQGRPAAAPGGRGARASRASRARRGRCPSPQLRAAAESVLQGYGGRRALRDAFSVLGEKERADLSRLVSEDGEWRVRARNIAAGSLGAGRLGRRSPPSRSRWPSVEDLWAIVLSKEEAAARQARVRDARQRDERRAKRQAERRNSGDRVSRDDLAKAQDGRVGAQVRIVIEGERKGQKGERTRASRAPRPRTTCSAGWATDHPPDLERRRARRAAGRAGRRRPRARSGPRRAAGGDADDGRPAGASAWPPPGCTRWPARRPPRGAAWASCWPPARRPGPSPRRRSPGRSARSRRPSRSATATSAS